MKREVYAINSGENTVYGELFYPEGEGKFPAVILSHGYNGVGRDFEKECEYYAENGFVCYAFDFCGGSAHARSTGKSMEMTVFSERQNLLDVFEEISRLPLVDEKNVFLFGGSQGGLVSLLAAERLKGRVRALALYYPALCIPDNWRQNYPPEKEIPESFDFWGLELGKVFVTSIRELNLFQEIGNYPNDIFIIHGDKDPIVPLGYSERLKEVYPRTKIVVLNGEGHGFSEEGGKEAARQVLSFMNAERKQ